MKGIYLIENIKSGEKYIGSSHKIHSRWGIHLRLLLQNKHHSAELQESFNNSTISDLKFSILEIVNRNTSDKELEGKESDYSILIGGAINRLPLSRDGKANFNHKRETVIDILKTQNRYKPMYLVDLDNNILGEYELQWEISKASGIGIASLRTCLFNRRYHTKGVGFVYKNEYETCILAPAKPRKWSIKERPPSKLRIKVEVYTVYGDFYKEYGSIHICADAFNVNIANLFKTLNLFPKKILCKAGSEISKYIFLKSTLENKEILIKEWKSKYDKYKEEIIDNIGNIEVFDIYDNFLGISSYENISKVLNVKITSIREVISMKNRRIQIRGFKLKVVK